MGKKDTDGATGDEGTETPPSSGSGSDEKKSYTQAEIDGIVEGRLKREREKYVDYDDLKSKAAKWEEQENANRSELERAQGTAAEEKKRADGAELSALKLDVALDKAPEGMSPADVRKLAPRLSGTTREELEKDAEELFEDFGGKGSSSNGSGGPPSQRPREKLRGGGDAGEGDDEPNVAEIVKNVPRL